MVSLDAPSRCTVLAWGQPASALQAVRLLNTRVGWTNELSRRTQTWQNETSEASATRKVFNDKEKKRILRSPHFLQADRASERQNPGLYNAAVCKKELDGVRKGAKMFTQQRHGSNIKCIDVAVKIHVDDGR